jgi:hypothetical protein
MRTLIITGTATPLKKGVRYDVILYGQTETHPTCVYIGELKDTCSGHTELEKICAKKYAAYFNTNEANIISVTNFHMLPAQTANRTRPGIVIKIWRALIGLPSEERTAIYHKYLKEHGWPKENLEQKAAELHSYLQEYKGTEPQLLFYLWYQVQYMHTRFPAGFTSWHQTHHMLSIYAYKKSTDENSMMYKRREDGGVFAVANLAFEWTNAFEKRHRNTEWDLDLDFFHELEVFMQQREQFYKGQQQQRA